MHRLRRGLAALVLVPLQNTTITARLRPAVASPP